MFDSLLVVSRLALYLSLTLAFGLPTFVLQAMGSGPLVAPVACRIMRVAGAATAVSLLGSVVTFWAMAEAMSGAGHPGLVWRVTLTLLTQTTVGVTWSIRLILLVISLWLMASSGVAARARAVTLSILCAIALTTLAWAGHGAMSEGVVRWLHLATDIAHLLAAGAWIGALVALTLIARAVSHHADRAAVSLLADAAIGFARMGTLIVVVLIISGTINYILIAGWTFSGLVESLYGRLLMAKLGLFAFMLALASANRFRLAPALKKARSADAVASARSALVRSLYVETIVSVFVLSLVAWLGTLDPGGH